MYKLLRTFFETMGKYCIFDGETWGLMGSKTELSNIAKILTCEKCYNRNNCWIPCEPVIPTQGEFLSSCKVIMVISMGRKLYIK